MKKYQYISILLTVCLAFCMQGLSGQDTIRNRQKPDQAQTAQQKQQFVDADGDGYNDNAPDHDGDGIPNRLDSDWKKLQKRMRNGNTEFVDADGDGINDNLQRESGDRTGQQMEMKGRNEEGSSVQNQEQNRVQKGKRKGKN